MESTTGEELRRHFMLSARCGEGGSVRLAAAQPEIRDWGDFISRTTEPVCNTGFDRFGNSYISDEWGWQPLRSFLFDDIICLVPVARLDYFDLEG
jgi:hypothetical protein